MLYLQNFYLNFLQAIALNFSLAIYLLHNEFFVILIFQNIVVLLLQLFLYARLKRPIVFYYHYIPKEFDYSSKLSLDLSFVLYVALSAMQDSILSYPIRHLQHIQV